LIRRPSSFSSSTESGLKREISRMYALRLSTLAARRSASAPSFGVFRVGFFLDAMSTRSLARDRHAGRTRAARAILNYKRGRVPVVSTLKMRVDVCRHEVAARTWRAASAEPVASVRPVAVRVR
jgi:hypothetical protein